MKDGHDFRICRDIEIGKQYLRARYANQPDARFGILASSRDKSLTAFGVDNDFQARKRLRVGPWYGDGEGDAGDRSCRHLRNCITEFEAQGLELDATLVAWGTDFKLLNGNWSIDQMAQYRANIRDPWQLRANAYRVLLTRARDASVVFVPTLSGLDETYRFLVACGFRPLESSNDAESGLGP